MGVKTYYDVLEIETDANEAAIKSAYRRLAMRYHPDRNPGQPTDKFNLITQAYDVLKDPEKKARYDRLGHSLYLSMTSGRSKLDEKPKDADNGETAEKLEKFMAAANTIVGNLNKPSNIKNRFIKAAGQGNGFFAKPVLTVPVIALSSIFSLATLETEYHGFLLRAPAALGAGLATYAAMRLIPVGHAIGATAGSIIGGNLGKLSGRSLSQEAKIFITAGSLAFGAVAGSAVGSYEVFSHVRSAEIDLIEHPSKIQHAYHAVETPKKRQALIDNIIG